MGDKSELCLYCGRFTTLKNERDGLAQCDRPECIENRMPEEEDDWWEDYPVDC